MGTFFGLFTQSYTTLSSTVFSHFNLHSLPLLYSPKSSPIYPPQSSSSIPSTFFPHFILHILPPLYPPQSSPTLSSTVYSHSSTDIPKDTIQFIPNICSPILHQESLEDTACAEGFERGFFCPSDSTCRVE